MEFSSPNGPRRQITTVGAKRHPNAIPEYVIAKAIVENSDATFSDVAAAARGYSPPMPTPSTKRHRLKELYMLSPKSAVWSAKALPNEAKATKEAVLRKMARRPRRSAMHPQPI
mmetsp:Transcript_64077/g.139382  ORF Transcript_64077/g.139382 Transcript_64077/m.139382 type:complete len:114 (-) Transcript_64077:326-667(-)